MTIATETPRERRRREAEELDRANSAEMAVILKTQSRIADLRAAVGEAGQRLVYAETKELAIEHWKELARLKAEHSDAVAVHDKLCAEYRQRAEARTIPKLDQFRPF